MSADLAGIVLADRYRLEQRLARGGMADVYRGADLRLNRHVAVKIPHPHFADDPAYVERLRREAQTVAALTHPNIVAVYDQGEADGRPFFVMELVEGESLSTLLSREYPLTVSRKASGCCAHTHTHAYNCFPHTHTCASDGNAGTKCPSADPRTESSGAEQHAAR